VLILEDGPEIPTVESSSCQEGIRDLRQPNRIQKKTIATVSKECMHHDARHLAKHVLESQEVQIQFQRRDAKITNGQCPNGVRLVNVIIPRPSPRISRHCRFQGLGGPVRHESRGVRRVDVSPATPHGPNQVNVGINKIRQLLYKFRRIIYWISHRLHCPVLIFGRNAFLIEIFVAEDAKQVWGLAVTRIVRAMFT
jgi:hypothetical protein